MNDGLEIWLSKKTPLILNIDNTNLTTQILFCFTVSEQLTHQPECLSTGNAFVCFTHKKSETSYFHFRCDGGTLWPERGSVSAGQEPCGSLWHRSLQGHWIPIQFEWVVVLISSPFFSSCSGMQKNSMVLRTKTEWSTQSSLHNVHPLISLCTGPMPITEVF